MSPVFRHGRLRLYLLKLLDEAPRHGYEIIRLLQDRFLGVYAPSPGTIYPRLARLEEEGLVTHEEVGGKKVYRITDKGREQLRARLEDLADLEQEIAASAHEIAREVTEDVRTTIRNLREDLTSGTRWGWGGMPGAGARPGDREAGTGAREPGQGGTPPEPGASGPRPAPGGTGTDSGGTGASGTGASGTGASGTGASGTGASGRRAGGRGMGGFGPVIDLERLVGDFTRDLRTAAGQVQALTGDALDTLTGILDDTLHRIRSEVFGQTTDRPSPDGTRTDGDSAGGDAG